MHYYKFNIADWVLATAHLSLEEEAIYFRLINHYYDSEQPIPLETQSVFRRLRLGSVSDIALKILEEFFEKTEKGFAHKKCDELIKEYKKTVKKNKLNGSNGGRPRKDAASEETQSVSSGLPEETQSEPNPNPNHKLLTINQEPLTNIKNTIVSGEPPTSDQDDFELTDQPEISRLEKAPTCPHMKIIDLYHQILPECNRVIPNLWPGSDREKNLQARWRESEVHQSLDFWKWYFEEIRTLNDGFYISRDVGNSWIVDLQWLIKKSNFIKTIEKISSKNRGA